MLAWFKWCPIYERKIDKESGPRERNWNLASFLSDLTCHKILVNMMVNKYDNKMFSGKYNYNTKCSLGGLAYLCVCMCAFVLTDMWLYAQWTRIKKRKPLKQSGSPWPQLLNSDPFHPVSSFDYDKMPLGDHRAQKKRARGTRIRILERYS